MQTKEAAKRDEESKNRNILTAKWEQPAQAKDMSRSWRLRSKMDKNRLCPWRLVEVFWRLVLASIYEAVHMAIIYMLHVYCSVSYDNCHASACWSKRACSHERKRWCYVWDDTLPPLLQLLRQYSVHHSLFCTFVFVAISSFRIPIVSNRIETTFVAKKGFCLLKTNQ